MKWHVLPAIGLLVVVTAGPAAATEDFSGPNCLAHSKLAGYLDSAFGEGRVATGQLDSGAEIELFASRDGSWTLVEKRADGFGCVTASGHNMKVERLIRAGAIDTPS